MSVEDQTGKCVHQRGEYGYVLNSGALWDRLRRAQPGAVFAWDEERRLWVECHLVPVEDGRTIDPLVRDEG